MVINNSVDPLNVLSVQQRISLHFKVGGSLNKKHNSSFVYTTLITRTPASAFPLSLVRPVRNMERVLQASRQEPAQLLASLQRRANRTWTPMDPPPSLEGAQRLV
ncbi:unnamed protein product [Gadus morhua 'NCC']